MSATFSKSEILRSKKDIDVLFLKGRSLSQFPLRMCYLRAEGRPDMRILVSVPKRYFKRAVKRNLLKRRIREAFRLHKDQFAASAAGGMDIAFIYTAHEEHSFQRIEESLCRLIAAASTPAATAADESL